jgi:nucleoside-diphosphate-sugar epimerase
MRHAVTGATGFLGGEIARQLREEGHDVVALVRTPTKAAALTELGVELVPGDLEDAAALDRLCTAVDGVFHAAAWYKVGVPNADEIAERANVQGTRNVLEAARRNGVPRLAYTSTLAINSDTQGLVRDEDYRHEGPHLTPYDRTKAAAHRIVEEYAEQGLDVVIAMPGVIYGPGDTSTTGDIIAQVVAGRRPPLPEGVPLCWAHVGDVARGHLQAMEKGRSGRSYMLAGPQATIGEAARLAARIAGTKGPIVLPNGMIRSAAALMGIIEKVVPPLTGYNAETMRAALASYLGSPARAQQELGWTARSLEEGMTETVAALKA